MFGFSLKKYVDDAVRDGEKTVKAASADPQAPGVNSHVSRLRSAINDAIVRVPYYLPRRQDLTVYNFWTRPSAAPVAVSFGLTLLSWGIIHAKIASTSDNIAKMMANTSAATDLASQLAGIGESMQRLVSYSCIIGAIAITSTLCINIGFWVYKLKRQRSSGNVVSEAFSLGKLEASLKMLEAAANARDIEGMQQALSMIKLVSDVKSWTQTGAQ